MELLGSFTTFISIDISTCFPKHESLADVLRTTRQAKRLVLQLLALSYYALTFLFTSGGGGGTDFFLVLKLIFGTVIFLSFLTGAGSSDVSELKSNSNRTTFKLNGCWILMVFIIISINQNKLVNYRVSYSLTLSDIDDLRASTSLS